MKNLTLSSRIILVSIIVTSLLTCSNNSENDDSCPKPSNLSFDSFPTQIYFSFQKPENVNSVEIEYGPAGFNLGSGTTTITSDYGYYLTGLNPSTSYDIYVSSICSSTEKSSPQSLLSVSTESSVCQNVNLDIAIYQTSTDYIEVYANSNSSSLGYVEEYELEYGPSGFSLGSGILLTSNNYDFYVTDFEPETTYDFYVRAVCYLNDYGPYDMAQFTTISNCPPPFNLNVSYTGGSCSSLSASYNFSWAYGGSNITNFTIALPTLGNSPDNASQYFTSNYSIGFTGFSCSTRDFYVKANCDDGSESLWAGPYTFN